VETPADTAACWFEIALPVTADGADPATALLAEQGYDACEIRQQPDGTALFVLYAQRELQEEALAAAEALRGSLGTVSAGPARVRPIAEQSWTENWKRHFPPLRIGSRLAVLPPWESADQLEPGRTAIIVHPGMAFGTGHHETTGSCLLVLDRIVRPGVRVADVGCGSGILAIAALRLGAAHAVATDVDPEAIEATRQNASLNGVSERLDSYLCEGPPAVGQQQDMRFDIVLANIFAEKLIAMRTRLTSCVKPGGYLVLSGIDLARRAAIEAAFVARDWKAIDCITNGEWVTFLLGSHTHET